MRKSHKHAQGNKRGRECAQWSFDVLTLLRDERETRRNEERDESQGANKGNLRRPEALLWMAGLDGGSGGAGLEEQATERSDKKEARSAFKGSQLTKQRLALRARRKRET